jgi:hypothetical protein
MNFIPPSKSLEKCGCEVWWILFVPVILIYILVLIPIFSYSEIRNSVRWLRMPQLERKRRGEAKKAAWLAFYSARKKKPRSATVIEYCDDHRMVSIMHASRCRYIADYAHYCYFFEQNNCTEIKSTRFANTEK